MTDQKPVTEQQLDEIETRAAKLNSLGLPGGTWTASPCDEKSVMPPELAHVVEDVLSTGGAKLRSSVGVFGDEAHAEFAAHAREDVPALLAEVRRLRAVLEQIRHLHKDSPMGPCPVCIDADAAAAGGDGLVPYPCPTARLAGAQDCEPPHVRAAAAAAEGAQR
jgi:hypothetical protein